MFSLRIQFFSVWLLLMVSINLVHHISVTESQSTSKRNPVLGIDKNLKKEKRNEATNPPKVKKDIESETQRAIEDDFETELTTIGIDYRVTTNQTLGETFEANSTSDETSLMLNNETEITTPLFNSNVTKNDSLVPIIDETGVSPDYINSTQNELLLNLTTISSIKSITESSLTTEHTPTTQNITNPTNSTQMTNPETVNEVTDTLHESPILNSTVSAIESLTDSSFDENIDLNRGRNEEMVECVFNKQIKCKNYELLCFGSGEVDCGHKRDKRSRESVTPNRTEAKPEVFKLYLEKQSLSENIQNSKCVLTASENSYFSCEPLPLITDCSGRSICKPTDESTDLREGMPFWKVGLIAALTAIGFICFIIVAIIAYVSYNKLKVRPESSTNGYQSNNNPQNVTRV